MSSLSRTRSCRRGNYLNRDFKFIRQTAMGCKLVRLLTCRYKRVAPEDNTNILHHNCCKRRETSSNSSHIAGIFSNRSSVCVTCSNCLFIMLKHLLCSLTISKCTGNLAPDLSRPRECSGSSSGCGQSFGAIPPYDHPVMTTTPVLRALFCGPNQSPHVLLCISQFQLRPSPPPGLAPGH